MEIKVNISQKYLKAVVERLVNDFNHTFSVNTTKLAKVPSKATLVKLILKDKQFLSNYKKTIIRLIEEDILVDPSSALFYSNPFVKIWDSPVLDKYNTICKDIEEQEYRYAENAQAIKSLESRGYIVTKKSKK